MYSSLSMLTLLAGFCQAFIDLHNYEVVQIKFRNNEEERAIQNLVQKENLDVWRRLKKDMLYDIMMEKEMTEELRRNGFDVTIKIGGDILTKHTINKRNSIEPMHNVSFAEYNTLDEINEYLYHMQGNHPELATVSSLGQSFEGRDINMLTISNDYNSTGPIILMDAGMHAREWIGPMVAIYIAHETLRDLAYGLPDYHVTFAFIPVLNVDGYEYTWNTDRYWRKTRSDYGNECIGTDGNRNFDFHWNEVGSSSNPCFSTYHGPTPTSEPLTQLVSDYMEENSDRIMAYITLHSYNQHMMYPYGYTTDPPANAAELERVAALATAALGSVHGTVFDYGTMTDLNYQNSGSSRDYAHGYIGVPYVYTVELRDTGMSGYLLPEEEIFPSCEETFELFKVVVEAVHNVTVET